MNSYLHSPGLDYKVCAKPLRRPQEKMFLAVNLSLYSKAQEISSLTLVRRVQRFPRSRRFRWQSIGMMKAGGQSYG